MFQDLGALLMHLGSTDPDSAQKLAAQLDAIGAPVPDMQGMMKLGNSPQPTDSNSPQPTATGMPDQPSTDLGALLGQGQAGAAGTGWPESNDPGGATVAGSAKGGNPVLSAALAGGAQIAAKPNAMPEAPKGVVGGVKAPEHPTINPGVLQALAALLHGPAHTTNTARIGGLNGRWI